MTAEAEVEAELGDFRTTVRSWCRRHVPPDWRDAQTAASDAEFVAFQRAWFQDLRAAGYAVPHWPAEWGGGMPVPHQVVLYQELAAHDAPRAVLPFVAVHHAAATLLAAGSDEQRRHHLPAILDGELWCQGFSEPEAGSDLAALRTTARREGDRFVVGGQKLWVSFAVEADWCLLLARTDPDVPKRKGLSYLLLDMTSPGITLRPIRQANGEAHFCEMFLDDVDVPATNLVGAEGQGWPIAQATLSAERGTTMLELAERLGNAGFRWLLEACRRRADGSDGSRPIDDAAVRDRVAEIETDLVGLRSLCRKVVERSHAGTSRPADASIAKLVYSELLQRMADFGAEVVGLPTHTVLQRPRSSGWESAAWALDFISSWEWTIPGGTSEIQRTIIGERGLGLPREPVVPG